MRGCRDAGGGLDMAVRLLEEYIPVFGGMKLSLKFDG